MQFYPTHVRRQSVSKMLPNGTEIEQNVIPNRPKSDPKSTKMEENEAKMAAETSQGGEEASEKQVAKKDARGRHLGILEDFGCNVPHMGSVGVPKSSFVHKILA